MAKESNKSVLKTVESGPNKKSQYPLCEKRTLSVKLAKMTTVPINAVTIILGSILITKSNKGPIPIPERKKKINSFG